MFGLKKNCTSSTPPTITAKTISVLGSGCKSCRSLYETVCKAVDELGAGIATEYITDPIKLSEHGIMTTPAIMIDGIMVSAGRILKSDDIKKLLTRQNIEIKR